MLISSGYSSSGRQAAPGSGLHPGGDGARLPGARGPEEGEHTAEQKASPK